MLRTHPKYFQQHSKRSPPITSPPSLSFSRYIRCKLIKMKFPCCASNMFIVLTKFTVPKFIKCHKSFHLITGDGILCVFMHDFPGDVVFRSEQAADFVIKTLPPVDCPFNVLLPFIYRPMNFRVTFVVFAFFENRRRIK